MNNYVIFNDWLLNLNKEIKKRRKILLIDNCGPHNEPPELDRIRGIFHVQLHYKTAASWPQYHRRCKITLHNIFLRQILCSLEKNIQRKCNVKEAVEWTYGYWDDSNQWTVTDCWKYETTTKVAHSVSVEANFEDESNTHDI